MQSINWTNTTMEDESFQETIDLIQTTYIDKVLAFFRGDSDKLPSEQDFMKVRTAVLKQCDESDHNESLYAYFEQVVNEFLVGDLLPFAQGKTGEALLDAFVKCWSDFTMFSKLIERAFDYLNAFFLENLEEPHIGERCLQLFIDVFY